LQTSIGKQSGQQNSHYETITRDGKIENEIFVNNKFATVLDGACVTLLERQTQSGKRRQDACLALAACVSGRYRRGRYRQITA
jgi:hypothetical protein